LPHIKLLSLFSDYASLTLDGLKGMVERDATGEVSVMASHCAFISLNDVVALAKVGVASL
jgi:hypothetical protein